MRRSATHVPGCGLRGRHRYQRRDERPDTVIRKGPATRPGQSWTRFVRSQSVGKPPRASPPRVVASTGGVTMRVAVVAGMGLALGAAGLGGIAVASTPAAIPDSTTKIITSCVNKRTGKVRFIDAQSGERCRKSQRRVRFNKAGRKGAPGKNGARGPQGARGLTGKTGAVGPSGPSNGYVAVVSAKDLTAGTPTTVVQKSLPAGNYIVSASGTLDNTCTNLGPLPSERSEDNLISP